MFDITSDSAGNIPGYVQDGESRDTSQLMAPKVSRSLLLRFALNSTDLVDPSLGVPRHDVVILAAEDMYRRLFAVLIGQNLDMFQQTETRIFVDSTAFLVDVAILCLDAGVLAVFYFRQRRAFLPRLPTSIASGAAYVVSSRAVREHGDDEYEEEGEDETAKRWRGSLRPTYSFGRYVGVDGKLHVGIELDPLVMLVDGHALMVRQQQQQQQQQ
ncbi:hypothetical protein B0T26DRAFT_748445 [Lasiosphaeria miniovina]|uniref:Uncharacterized protein n=1 Tax=Lasiosphaeria miniovina TaxID=1954250 RepID=A0AA40B5W4_9PEZI|nr:uncharacterized protein B0T26DRAFT_748445 [Lasiosphaeria miniovina]KAK0728188.1 hypothetical protein B0T26DRAFT_748445 [Lasiosphaeria miniovina]